MRDRGDDDDVPAREERRGRGEPEPRDVVVLRGVLLDVEVGLGHVRLGLVVVVVRDEVLDRVVREELAELVAELRGQRLVVGDHERRPLDLLDDPGHRRRLAGAGRAEHRLEALAGLGRPRRARRSRAAGRPSGVRVRCLERRHEGQRSHVAYAVCDVRPERGRTGTAVESSRYRNVMEAKTSASSEQPAATPKKIGSTPHRSRI